MNKQSVKVSTLEVSLALLLLFVLVPGWLIACIYGVYVIGNELPVIVYSGFSGRSVFLMLLGTLSIAIALSPLFLLQRLYVGWTNFTIWPQGYVTLERRHFFKTFSCNIAPNRVTEVGIIEPEGTSETEDIWYWVYAVIDSKKRIFLLRHSEEKVALMKGNELTRALGLAPPRVYPPESHEFLTHNEIIDLITQLRDGNGTKP